MLYRIANSENPNQSDQSALFVKAISIRLLIVLKLYVTICNLILLHVNDIGEDQPAHSDSFTIFGLWVLGLAVSHINESNCKLMSLEHYFSLQMCNTIASWDSLK